MTREGATKPLTTAGAEYQRGGSGKRWRFTSVPEPTAETRRGDPGKLAFRF